MQRPFPSILILILVTLLVGGCLNSATQPFRWNWDHTLLQADSVVTAAIRAEELAGAVLMVSVQGEIKLLNAYGFARQFAYGGASLPKPTPMTPNHVFDLASLTKVFATTFGAMLLVDQEKIALDDPVNMYLPAFSSPSKDSITVRHLLSHTAGLSPWKPTYYHAENKQETLDYISELELAYPVGQARHYSDLGFMLMGYIIENISGSSLDAFSHENLYNPLGLTQTGFNPDANLPLVATSHGNPFEKRMVADDNFGYECDEDPESFTAWRTRVLLGEVNDGNAYHAHGGIAGHAGLFSNAAELQILLELLLNNGTYRDKELIKPEVIQTFLTPNNTDNGLGWAMASNVLLVDDLPPGTFGHTGFTGTYAIAVPAHELSIVLLTNRQHAGVGEDGRYPSINDLRRSVVTTVLGAFNSQLDRQSNE
ncbi:MAG: serine hydrolase domain-containing protein [Rhodothermales bacterium]